MVEGNTSPGENGLYWQRSNGIDIQCWSDYQRHSTRRSMPVCGRFSLLIFPNLPVLRFVVLFLRWRGRCNGKIGWFPSDRVELMGPGGLPISPVRMLRMIEVRYERMKEFCSVGISRLRHSGIGWMHDGEIRKRSTLLLPNPSRHVSMESKRMHRGCKLTRGTVHSTVILYDTAMGMTLGHDGLAQLSMGINEERQ